MTKRYSLLKKYPGLPKDWEVGMIVGLGDRNYGFSPESGKYSDNYIDNNIENEPEYWEKVVEKDYEILIVKTKVGNILEYKGEKCIKRSDSRIVSSTMRLSEILKNDVSILSVKRLSDEKLFSVGDKINIGVITKLEIKNEEIYVWVKNALQIETWYYFDEIKIIEKPLFTTEDGVNIEIGVYSYGLHKDSKEVHTYIWNKREHFNEVSLNKNVLYFSTEAKAKEYIKYNKPVLSLNDVKNVIAGKDFISTEFLIKKLESNL